jgi:hypothetical protein
LAPHARSVLVLDLPSAILAEVYDPEVLVGVVRIFRPENLPRSFTSSRSFVPAAGTEDRIGIVHVSGDHRALPSVRVTLPLPLLWSNFQAPEHVNDAPAFVGFTFT